MRQKSRTAIVGLTLAAAGLLALPAGAQVRVGQTDAVVRSVEAALSGTVRQLAKADAVYHEERIATEAASATVISFLDETILTIGEGSDVVLDSFVFDPNRSLQEVVVNVSKGALRFVGGPARQTQYSIRTPSLQVGVRGTTFTVAVAEDGSSAVYVEEGEVEVTRADGGGSATGVSAGAMSSAAVGTAPTAPTAPDPAMNAVSAALTATVAVNATPAVAMTPVALSRVPSLKSKAKQAATNARGTSTHGAGSCAGG